jgi:alkylation response protein AidB-like acyl-CoA dehydrogenase
VEELGYRLAPGPFLATVLCGSALLEGASPEQQERFLPALAAGEQIMVPALYEPSLRADGVPEQTRAVRQGDGYRLNGVKLFVEYAAAADFLLVPAAVAEGDGVSLFLVEAGSDGLHGQPLETMDGSKHQRVVLEGVSVPAEQRLGNDGMARGILERLMLRQAAGACAWMVGGAEWVLKTTVEYAKQRVQFDQPIGSFQAIQHRCANMAVEYDAARFLMLQAAWRLSEGLPCEREVAMAKARVGQAYERICLESHQVHGAIGFTSEYDLHLYTRRAKAAEMFFGDARWQRERVAQLMELEPAGAR